MSTSSTQHRACTFGRSFLLLLLCILPWLGTSCTGTVIPSLQHFKRPLSMAPVYVNVSQCRPPGGTVGEAFCASNAECTDGKTCVSEGKRYYTYVANADMDRLLVVWSRSPASGDSTFLRELLLDPTYNSPGLLYIPTGRYPVEVIASPDNKRVFVLNGGDGDISIINPVLQKPFADKDGNPIRFPKDCKTKGTCWKNPRRMVLYQETPDRKLFGFVLSPEDQSLSVIDLDEKSVSYGEVTKRFALGGTPSDLILNAEKRALYVTNSSADAIHRIDPKDLTVKTIRVGLPTQGGSVTDDDKLLYLIELKHGGVLIYDLEQNQVLPQGDQRFPERSTIQLDSAAVLSVKFLPEIFVPITDKDGNAVLTKGKFAWATASDGYGYLLDITNHRLFNSDQRGPEALNFLVFVGTDGFGDAREPTRTTLPKISRQKTTDVGVNLIASRIVSEKWTLSYEKTFVSNRNGRFADLAKGVFLDKNGFDLERLTVQKDDVLVLQD